MCRHPPGPAHPHSTYDQGAILQLLQAPVSHQRHPILAPADEGLRVTLGTAVEEGVTSGVLHLVSAGVPVDDGCLWKRERGGRGGREAGWAPQPAPASTYL